MTIIQQLEFMRDALADWARSNKAELFIGSDTGHVLTQILNRPGVAQAYVMLQSEEMYGETDEAGMMKRSFLVVLSRGRGLALDPASNLLKQVGTVSPLYDLVESARDTLRVIEFPIGDVGHEPMGQEKTPMYRGFRPWRGSGGLPFDAIELEFELFVQI